MTGAMFLLTHCSSVPRIAPCFSVGRYNDLCTDCFFSLLFIYLFSGPSVTQTESKMSRRGLMEQDLSKLNVMQLHPLSPEVISRQATINIGNALLLMLFL